MTIPKAKYDEFCDDLNSKFVGICQENYRGYNQPRPGDEDFILGVPLGLRRVIQSAFAPIAFNSRQRFGTAIVEFAVSDADEVSPLLTPEGREIAYNSIPASLASALLDKSGRYGECLSQVSQSTGIDEAQIDRLVQIKVENYKSEFSEAGDYATKNTALQQMLDLHDLIRDVDALSEFVAENNRPANSRFRMI